MIYAEIDTDGHYEHKACVEYECDSKITFDALVWGPHNVTSPIMIENIIKRAEGAPSGLFGNGISGINFERDNWQWFSMVNKDPYYQRRVHVDTDKLVRVHAERTQDIRELAAGVGTIALCGTAIACVSHNVPSRIGYPTCLAVGAVSAFISAWFTRNK